MFEFLLPEEFKWVYEQEFGEPYAITPDYLLSRTEKQL